MRTARRVLSKGSQGRSVRQLQRSLNIKVDGDFGQATKKAVKKWKRRHGNLSPRGIVRGPMWRKLGYRWHPHPPVGALVGSPRQIINRVIWDAQRHGFTGETVAGNDAANARHGSTVNGGKSMHEGPPHIAWATDLSDGVWLSKRMRRYARRLARKFDVDWYGTGLANSYQPGWKIQLIWGVTGNRNGGEHRDHVHFGLAKR